MERKSRSVRPLTHPERASCMATIATIMADGGLNAVVETTLAEEYHPAATAYDQAWEANQRALSAVVLAATEVGTWSVVFAEAFTKWTISLDATHGKRVAAALLRPYLRRTPSGFLKLRPRTRVHRAGALLVHVDAQPSLSGDRQAMEALRAATASLEAAVDAHEAAVLSRTRTVTASIAATKAFDKAYGLLVKDLQRYAPDAALPVFVRTRPATRSTACADDEVPADAEPDAPADADPA